MTYRDVSGTPREILESRRKAALAALGAGVMVLPAAPVQYASRDGERPYHPDRELFYLTGATEAGSVAVLAGAEKRYVLFVRERDPEAELWAGPRLGPDGAAELFGPDECHPLTDLDVHLPELLRGGDRLFYRLGRHDALERHVVAALGRARTRGARTGSGPRAVIDPGAILDDLRLLKDDHEVALLRRAAALSVDGHMAAAGAIAPGTGEWVVQATLEATFRAAGGGGPAYGTIVGSGPSACVLHYVENSSVIQDDALVLVDAGAEYGLYNGDVTRTYPASGSFSGPQRDVYQVVDEARRAAIAVVEPGASVADVHFSATRVLVEGLVELGALAGDVDDLIEGKAHRPFYPHQTSHWLGLDVHDPGDYERSGESRALEPGMVLTVEPGLYFGGASPGPPAALAGVGVRIEDDVLVTPGGCEVLTAGLPTDVEAVEALVRHTT